VESRTQRFVRNDRNRLRRLLLVVVVVVVVVAAMVRLVLKDESSMF
jgi:hypothetical protein